MSINQNDLAPDFTLPSTGESPVTLSQLRGRKVVLYFYPKDSTPGCTTESIDFGQRHDEFLAQNCLVFGISRDSLRSHEKFKSKHAMPFELLSDEVDTVARSYETIKMKNMYGKQFEGIERSTFLIDTEGKVAVIWRKVKVPGHVDEVFAAVQALN